jgi:hypothetical protein
VHLQGFSSPKLPPATTGKCGTHPEFLKTVENGVHATAIHFLLSEPLRFAPTFECRSKPPAASAKGPLKVTVRVKVALRPCALVETRNPAATRAATWHRIACAPNRSGFISHRIAELKGPDEKRFCENLASLLHALGNTQSLPVRSASDSFRETPVP